MPLLHGLVDLQQRNRCRLAPQPPPAANARLRINQICATQAPQNSAHKDRIGVDAASHMLRSYRIVRRLRQQCQNVDCYSELAIGRDSSALLFVFVTSIVSDEGICQVQKRHNHKHLCPGTTGISLLFVPIPFIHPAFLRKLLDRVQVDSSS